MINEMMKVFPLADTVDVCGDGSYVKTYPYFVSYLSGGDSFTEEKFFVGCHMVYGWMPTIIELNFHGEICTAGHAVDLLQKAKNNGCLNVDEIKRLSFLVNNSVVGLSKLLHFVSPGGFAIWDSRVYKFIYNKKPHQYQVNNADIYVKYLEALQILKNDARFPNFFRIVNEKIGYEVSPLRALEIVMFCSSK